MTFISYAQNFEDVLLWRALGHTEAGFYIDVGASHPDTDSVTRAFYDRGWRGINIEPTSAAFRQLAAARGRDVNLNLALGRSAGTATFYMLVDENTGLSTLSEQEGARYKAQGMHVVEATVTVDTLAAVCHAHAPADIQFLKVDVEGAERAVLEGADFERFRPWIVLVEATAPMSTVETHAEWEPILLEAGYRFVWFDGLNRFYVAAERHDALAPAFRTPPNVFDDFVRVADTEWARRIHAAEGRAEASLQRARDAEHRLGLAEHRTEKTVLQLARATVDAARLRTDLEDKAQLEQALARATAEWDRAVQAAGTAAQGRAEAEAWLEAIRRSTSWRLTGPLRRILSRAGSPPAPAAPSPPDQARPNTAPEARPAPRPPAPGHPPNHPPRTAVHQFHSGTARGDAITNAMLLTRRLLRGLGYDSRIFAEHLDPALAGDILPIDSLPRHDRYVLIIRHSMGHDALEHLLGLPAPKVLLYHNITPPDLLEGSPFLQEYARKGRAQLQQLRPAVAATITDSAYNAIELIRAGFDAVEPCTLLFDLDAMRATAPPRAPDPTLFTVLFVGRLAPSKNQLGLAEAFARFRAQFPRATRLVLVGRHDDPAYAAELLGFLRTHGLDHGAIELTGPLSDQALRQRFATADLYVSLSTHEGFGVPLIEAVAHGVPVVAVAAGAVPYTLGDGDGLLPDASPAGAAARMLSLAGAPEARAELLRRQQAALDRFSLPRQLPSLIDALVRAGAARPVDPDLRDQLAARASFTVAGHLNGSYSLADVNRQLALALDAERPGAVRVIPVEGDATTTVDGIPATCRRRMGALLARPAPLTAPTILISQHYPVWVPPEPGDVTLAFFFWEETLVPAHTVATLEAGFDGVLAPTATVAKALIDSGVRVPVRVIGHAPDLEPFRRLRARREARLPGPPFTVLHVSSAFPRKGIDVLLAAYARAFRRTDAVRLVIKAFPNPHNTVAEDLARLRDQNPDLAEVELIDRDLDAAALLDLYRDADVMVLPTRGEGYNLPAAEAIAAGLPVITTGWGGHMDMVANAPPGAVRTLAYRFAPSRSHLATPFSLWAEPDEDDLVASLHEARAAAPQPAPAGVEHPPRLAATIAGFAADLLTRPAPPPPPRIGWISTWDVRCGIAEYTRQLVTAIERPATVFADVRTGPREPTDALQVLPTWTLADPDTIGQLMSAVVRTDSPAVVVQHQPGLMPWRLLPAVLLHPALHDRVVVVALHNVQDLLDQDPDVRQPIVAALRAMSRVVVHTLRDLDALAGLGLSMSATFIPQGAPQAAEPAPVRALSPQDDVLLGCYGFFLPRKGIPQLIEAAALLRQAWPRLRLRLVNAAYPLPESASEIEASRAVADRHGLSDAVAFETAFLDPVASRARLTKCDPVVLPSMQSTGGSHAALRGALAAGVPVAVTNLPLFDEAEDAVLRLPGLAPQHLAAGLDAMLRDRAARAAASAASRDWLAARHWPLVARRWEALIDGLAASKVIVGPAPPPPSPHE